MATAPDRFMFWERLPVYSLLRRVIGQPPEAPLRGYVRTEYVWMSQVNMWGHHLIDTLELPFNWPDLRVKVDDRARRFFSPGPDGHLRLSKVWKQRRMPAMYRQALEDLCVMVEEWLSEYEQWLARTQTDEG